MEDDPVQCAGIERALNAIPLDDQKRHGISSFEILTAKSANSARRLLTSAKEQGRPFDVALLDLCLPVDDGGKNENPKHGQEILRAGLCEGTISKAIIISAFNDPSHIVGAFRGGAVDFIAKPYEKDDLLHRVLFGWERDLADRSEKHLHEFWRTHVKHLCLEAERSLSRRMDSAMSDHLREINRKTEDLLVEVCQRQGLDPARDSADPLILRVTQIQRSLDWPLSLNPGGPPRSESAEAGIEIGESLSAVRDEAAPCLHAKGVEMEWPDNVSGRARSYDRGVEMVVREIVLGGLVGIPNAADAGAPHRAAISVHVTSEDDRIALMYEDTLEEVPDQAREAINHAEPIPSTDFSRIWGLAVAQQVAVWGGGRIALQSREGGGNRITYFIPKASK